MPVRDWLFIYILSSLRKTRIAGMQFYATKRILLCAKIEMKSGKLAFKDMDSGEQKEFSIDEIIEQLK